MAIWDELSSREQVRSCLFCETNFSPGRKTQLYCSAKCRTKYWVRHKQLIEIELDNKDTVLSARLNNKVINPITVRIDYKPSTKGELVNCQYCNTRFNQVRTHQKFCSSQCRYRHWVSLNP